MALYTKYRPSDFDNLVGQTFIKETLKKAIAEDKTIGAYLFCGPRGTGKTSTARLFAKTVNCLNSKDGNPCLKCEICTEFQNNSLVDIVEIDAASHTGVDNIREIIEKAQFSPTKTKYKIYIIDEVHMLSKGAFNALLKILEEPPKHVKFILATTETHKVPETIISRCQRYDFKRISKKDISDRLEFIAKSEKVKIDKKSLEYIVGASAGGLRNAISLFEQMISNSEVKYENIIEKLGITGNDELENFLEKLLEKDVNIIDTFENISASGKNIKLFIKDLIFLTKNKAIENIKKAENISSYINILEILDDAYIKSKNSLDEETTFLVGILKIIEGNEKLQVKSIKSIGTQNIKKDYKKTKETLSNNSSKGEQTQKIDTNKGELSSDELNDIFGETEKNKKLLNQELEKEKYDNGNNLQNFEISKFLEKLKENKVKGGILTSIKSSKVNLDGNILKFNCTSKMYKATLENIENQDIIIKSLSDLGFENIVLDVK